eukprot:2971034-Pleurochrysis_carterae.AAC.1
MPLCCEGQRHFRSTSNMGSSDWDTPRRELQQERELKSIGEFTIALKQKCRGKESNGRRGVRMQASESEEPRHRLPAGEH